ncbi:MAG: peptidase [Haloplasmataceae bacterium]|jgi:carboxyl-terminal processing protease|nr:peptidase [Haloplasmataceae bacterium]
MKNSFSYKICILFLVMGLTLGISGCTFFKKSESNSNFHAEIDKLLAILKENSFYYENEEELYEGALRGIVASLEDPYSTYFDEEEYNNFLSQLQASFAGLGVTIGTKGSYPIVTSVITDSPASKAGIKVGDTLLKVDGEDLKGKSNSEIASLIKGPKGSARSIVIASDDMNNQNTINVTLDTVTTDTVLSEVIEVEDKKIGYLVITTFGEPTTLEFENAMETLKSQNIDGLIIDVRSNPGGYLSTVKSMLDYFIDSEDPFMYQQYNDEEKVPYYLKDGKSYNMDDIVILINEYSASASEIFAATMKELKNYQLIGKTTFGKGTVQVTNFIDDDETKTVKYTTSLWLTSTGVWIHGNGVNPSIDVELIKFKDLAFLEYSEDLMIDHVDQEIKEMQVLLTRLGYITRTDGYFNIQTSDAVRDFQEDYMGIDRATGFVTEETIYELNLELIKYLNNLENDEQYLKAIEYIVQN